MSRAREFSSDDVIAAAADVFTTHGYGATSMAMLLEATELGKQSLYNAFGDKASLYLKALDCAIQRMGALTHGMAAAPTGREAIEVFFSNLVEACASGDPVQRTCAVSSGLLEGIEHPLIAQTLQARWRGSHELLRAAIERGQRDRSIVSGAPSAALADALMSSMSGLRVTARAELGEARLASAARLATSILDHL